MIDNIEETGLRAYVATGEEGPFAPLCLIGAARVGEDTLSVNVYVVAGAIVGVVVSGWNADEDGEYGTLATAGLVPDEYLFRA